MFTSLNRLIQHDCGLQQNKCNCLVPFLPEFAVEQTLLEQLAKLKYKVETEDNIGPDGKFPERESHSEVILIKRLLDAAKRINNKIPKQAIEEAVKKLTQNELPQLTAENRRIHKLLIEGVDIEYEDKEGFVSGKVNLIDFENIENNDWLAVNQYVVIDGERNRRPDVVVFINGLPIVVIELKAPGSDSGTMIGAFNQLQTYKEQIPALFKTNSLLVISDGLTAQIGSLTSDFERFMPWRTVDGKEIAKKGLPE
jgi:type I restriction enzyme R subunit